MAKDIDKPEKIKGERRIPPIPVKISDETKSELDRIDRAAREAAIQSNRIFVD